MMRIFCNTRSTQLEQSCIWMLQILFAITMVTSICTAQPIEDSFSSLYNKYDYRPTYPQERVLALYNGAIRERRGHQHMTDAGYGSRVAAASKLASALIAHDDLFGSFGPGRKKRDSQTESDTYPRDQPIKGDYSPSL